ncbi:cAMP-regulated phosphoprotein 21, partial [Arapaima gigas]
MGLVLARVTPHDSDRPQTPKRQNEQPAATAEWRRPACSRFDVDKTVSEAGEAACLCPAPLIDAVPAAETYGVGRGDVSRSPRCRAAPSHAGWLTKTRQQRAANAILPPSCLRGQLTKCRSDGTRPGQRGSPSYRFRGNRHVSCAQSGLRFPSEYPAGVRMSEVDTVSLEESPEALCSAREVDDTAPPSSCPCSSPSPAQCVPPSCSLDESDARGDQQRRALNQGQPRKRAKSKGKLVRSLAVCDESSLPLPVDGAEDNQGSIQLQITALPCFPEDSKPGGDEPDKDRNRETEKSDENPRLRALPKDHSQEYTDSTGIDLHDFLVNTLQKNPRDRIMLLKLEQEMMDFIADNNTFKKFPQMSSYHRMLVHRVAAYFGMEHNVDQTGKSVIINKTSNTRIPEQRFGEHVRDEKSEDSQKRFILKRDNSGADREDGLHRIHPFREDRRSRSMEEREEEYLRVRERIFAQDVMVKLAASSLSSRILEDCSLHSDTQKKRQLFRGNRDGSGRTSGSRQSSTETDSRWSEPRPWSSTDSDSSCRNYRPAVTKTASIGGITVLSRGDGGTGGRGSGKLSKTGSESSSSGGSSGSLSRVHLSFQGPALLPSAPPNSGGGVAFPDNQGPPSSPGYILVSLDSAGIPPGSILVNPHTGQPFVNPDGSPAVYNPPVGQQPASKQSQQAQQQAPPPPLPPQQPLASHVVPQRDDLPAQFGQMSLSRQPSGEASEPPSTATVYPPDLLPQPP